MPWIIGIGTVLFSFIPAIWATGEAEKQNKELLEGITGEYKDNVKNVMYLAVFGLIILGAIFLVMKKRKDERISG